MNIGNLLLASARQHPQCVAVATGDRVDYRYADLARRALRLANGLRARNVLAGERIAIALPNCAEYFVIKFGAWLAGCAVVPINAKLHAKEMQFIVENCEARLCFSQGDLLEGLASVLMGQGGDGSSTQLIDVAGEAYEGLFIEGAQTVAEVRPEDPAWLFYTSGTTGRPKGATLTHRNLLFMTQAYYADVDRIEPDDSIIHPAPLSHGAGLYALPHFAAGAANVVPASGGFDSSEIFGLLATWRGVSLFAAPTMVVRLLREFPGDEAVRNLKTLVYGGAPMYVTDALKAVHCFGPRLFHLYGQGESPMTITGLPKRLHVDDGRDTLMHELGSCGFPRTGVEVRILGDEGQPLPAGEIGEVATRSDCVMTGYWNDAKATASALCDGWLLTGDVGLTDERGMLVLKDRAKDLIISGGSNIYPREIEEVLLEHPAVRECAVVGQPDPEWGENVVAFVVCDQPSDTLTAELDEKCLHAIARFKRPKSYRFCDTLPKNAYGKVLKTKVREML